jgi:hypothetical protein
MTNRIDHTNCTHLRTPAGRAACRAGKATPASPITPTRSTIAADLRKLETDQARRVEADRNSRIKVQVTEDIAKARRQPTARRGKVAVSDPRTCVQWELHTGSGRCACGWAA